MVAAFIVLLVIALGGGGYIAFDVVRATRKTNQTIVSAKVCDDAPNNELEPAPQEEAEEKSEIAVEETPEVEAGTPEIVEAETPEAVEEKTPEIKAEELPAPVEEKPEPISEPAAQAQPEEEPAVVEAETPADEAPKPDPAPEVAATKPVEKPTVKRASKPAAKATAKATAKPTAKSAEKATAKTAEKATTKTATKPAAKPAPKPATKPAAKLEPSEVKEKVTASEVDALMQDEVAASFIVQSEKVADKTKQGIINIDTLSQCFEKGETVTLEEIKKRVARFNKQTTYLKVLARGTLDKALTVEADSFSLQAVKMIVLTGGKAVKKK